jgi:phosphate transport system ATP-binding protein
MSMTRAPVDEDGRAPDNPADVVNDSMPTAADPETAAGDSDRLGGDGRAPGRPIRLAPSSRELRGEGRGAAIELQGVSCYYGSFRAIRDASIEIDRNRVTALIGPSGCGKSTLLRTMNRLNDLIPGFRLEGKVLYDGADIYARDIDAVDIRRRVGMVFQRPNPFPKSIYDNVAFGPRVNGFRGNETDIVEESLRRAALWEEVKDKLRAPALTLSGGQQQRLCIARAIAIEPEVVLMDEPASALDPRATLQIEELMRDLAERFTIVVVTHNMQQAARASDVTVFMTMGEDRAGYVVEVAPTADIFTNPRDRITEDYVSGRFG